jgi:hypothetical protein
MERITGRNAYEKRLNYLVHEQLYFGEESSTRIPSMVIDRDMFIEWNSNLTMNDRIHKRQSGGREGVTREEVDKWYDAAKKEHADLDNLILSKDFPDCNEVTWGELDGARRRFLYDKKAAEEAAEEAAREAAWEADPRSTCMLLSNTWIMAFVDVACFIPLPLGCWLVSLF